MCQENQMQKYNTLLKYSFSHNFSILLPTFGYTVDACTFYIKLGCFLHTQMITISKNAQIKTKKNKKHIIEWFSVFCYDELHFNFSCVN